MKRLFKKRYLLLLLVLALAGWWWRSRATKPVEVKTAKVERKDLVSSLSVSGKVDALGKATLNFPSGGKLGFVKVKIGDVVKTGETLVGLDLGDLQANERATYYNYIAADAAAKVAEDAVKGHDSDETFVQKNTRVAAQTARDKAYDGWLVAQRAVRNAVLKSPMDGVVTDISVSVVGDTVSVADGVTVVDPGTLYFDTSVNETDLSRVHVGQQAVVNLDAFSDKPFDGIVSRIGYAAKIGDTGATVLPIWITLPVGDIANLKLGLNGDAALTLGEVKGALVLPIEAVRDSKVTLVSGEEKKIETGLESDFEIEVKSGLGEGDVVVIK